MEKPLPKYSQHVQHQLDKCGQTTANYQPQQPTYIQQQPGGMLIVQQPYATRREVILQTAERPNSHLAWSICGCLCCVWPIGIHAIILSQKSTSAYDQGDIDAAKKYSNSAFVTNIVNMLMGLSLITTLIIIQTSSK